MRVDETLVGCATLPPFKNSQFTESNLPRNYRINNVPYIRQVYSFRESGLDDLFNEVIHEIEYPQLETAGPIIDRVLERYPRSEADERENLQRNLRSCFQPINKINKDVLIEILRSIFEDDIDIGYVFDLITNLVIN